jgi:hypothetical protein
LERDEGQKQSARPKKEGMTHLISSSIAKAREEREEFGTGRCARLFFEDDRVQL